MIRISITGPESTGKSWLAEHLANYYHTCWVPEYSRIYLKQINRKYTYKDILNISKGQFRAEEKASNSSDLIFCDTDFLVTSIWCTVKYSKCHPWITEKLRENRYDLYLLCNIDLPWEFDPLREHQEMRAELFAMYQQVLKSNNFNFQIISGIGMERLQNAIQAIDELLMIKT